MFLLPSGRHVPEGGPSSWGSRRTGPARATSARPATHICGAPALDLVPRRRRCPGSAPAAGDLPGPRLLGLDSGLSRHHRGALARSDAAIPRAALTGLAGRSVMRPPITRSLPDLVQAFFRRHLIGMRGVSPHTLAAYRDAIRRLLLFAAGRRHGAVVQLSLDDLGRDTVLAFLEYLEQQRGNAAVTRNARLAAIHALFRFIAMED